MTKLYLRWEVQRFVMFSFSTIENLDNNFQVNYLLLMIYEINHIWTAEMKRKWRNARRSERNLCIWVKKPEKIQDFNGVWTRDLAITGAMLFKPCWSPNFFQASLRNCINCVHWDDHFFIFKLFTVSIKRGMFLLANSVENSRHCIAISFSRRLWRWMKNLIIEESMVNFWGSLPNSVLVATFGHCLFTNKFVYNNIFEHPKLLNQK